MSDTETATRPVWRWWFHSESELRAALEEYHVDGAKVARYGEATGRGASPGADYDHRLMRIWRQNAEIDRRMAAMEKRAPWIHRLLDVYFRGGLCDERDGWVVAAKRCGLPADRDSRWDQDAFEHQVAWCVSWLWHTR